MYGADHGGHRERDEEDRPERPAELRHPRPKTQAKKNAMASITGIWMAA
jgi:hypothetical protein